MEAGSPLPHVRDVGEIGGFLMGQHAILLRFRDYLPDSRKADIHGGRCQVFH